ncbi:MAG: hypothetical protein UMU76_01710, partial [Prosthecochloris sp.]|nr:hypothetical protein [Prosthecochloris sp.]
MSALRPENGWPECLTARGERDKRREARDRSACGAVTSDEKRRHVPGGFVGGRGSLRASAARPYTIH